MRRRPFETFVWAIVAALLVLIAAGCVRTNIAQALKAAGQDNATVCVSTTNIYGNFAVARANPAHGDVTCNATQGLVIKSPAMQIGVPITVFPQFTVAPPP